MKRIKTTILASDMVGKFSDYQSCAITKAIQRVGVEGEHIFGEVIMTVEGNTIIGIVATEFGDELGITMCDMYDKATEPKDIEATVVLIESDEERLTLGYPKNYV